MSISENTQSFLDLGKYAGGAFIDLRKAFDTVDHDILVKQTEHYDVKEVPNRWFRTYLK